MNIERSFAKRGSLYIPEYHDKPRGPRWCPVVPGERGPRFKFGAPQVVTIAGTAGTTGSFVGTLTIGPYNQAAGNCMVLAFNWYQSRPYTIADIAGNTFTNVVLDYGGGNSNQIFAIVVPNCLGSAVNVVTLTFQVAQEPEYATFTYFDVTNCATSSVTDVVASATTVTTGSSISQTITTMNANEAILTMLFQDSAGLAGATPPTSFSAGSVVDGYSIAASRVVSSIQSGVTLTWSGITNTADYDMFVISLLPAASAYTKTLNASMKTFS